MKAPLCIDNSHCELWPRLLGYCYTTTTTLLCEFRSKVVSWHYEPPNKKTETLFHVLAELQGFAHGSWLQHKVLSLEPATTTMLVRCNLTLD